MTKKAVKNIGASIRDRLRNEAKRLGNDFNLILERYALERVLYRLSYSEYKSRFILKGGMLLSIWQQIPIGQQEMQISYPTVIVNLRV